MADFKTFTWRPQVESDARVTHRTLGVQFGDGYEQVAGDGINTRREQWSVVFVASKATIADIKAFIDSLGGYEPFWFTTSNGAQKLFTCNGYRESVKSNSNGTGVSQVSAEFTEYFL